MSGSAGPTCATLTESHVEAEEWDVQIARLLVMNAHPTNRGAPKLDAAICHCGYEIIRLCHRNSPAVNNNVSAALALANRRVDPARACEILPLRYKGPAHRTPAVLPPAIYASAREFLSHPRILAPGCLVSDVALANVSGLDLQSHIISGRGAMQIIPVITGHGDVPIAMQAMKAHLGWSSAQDVSTSPRSAWGGVGGVFGWGEGLDFHPMASCSGPVPTTNRSLIPATKSTD